jgi:hypothetical protein
MQKAGSKDMIFIGNILAKNLLIKNVVDTLPY